MWVFQSINLLGNRIINRAHVFVFGKDIGSDMVRFVRNMSYMGLGAIVSGVILFVVQVVAVRVLGPEEYGKVALVFTAANFLPLFMLMGLQASVIKYLPEYKEQQNIQTMVISTGVAGGIFFMGIFAILFVVARDMMARLFDIPFGIVTIAIVYSVFTAVKLGAESILKGMLQFRTQAVMDVLYSVITFFVFFGLFLSKRLMLTFVDYLITFSVGLLVYALTVFMRNKQYIRVSSFDRKTLKTLLHYGFYSIVGSISLFILWGSDRFFLNKFLDIRSVGIYAVYYGASLMILGRFISVFMKVFLPTASSSQDKAGLDRKLNRLMKVTFFPLFLFNAFIIYILLLIYGKDYPVDVVWIFLFAFNAILYTFINAKGSLLVSEGVRGQRFYSVWSVSMAFLVFILNLFMIPAFGIAGAILSVIIVSLLFLIGLSLYSRRILVDMNGSGNAADIVRILAPH
ncbi:hypothetical protein A3H10_03530 [Candidatus Uhrbacteria bacterium RIFCSPLOWO2_12_FULL_46_10]|uniref:Polysaccharide biosynthesis protein C-terminal domain-containing protein n=1 Tax=Candidatus Uhrbacteria bacterium RIFCSPLOWO2_01_FULL_47_25 TaxID=1802402 RepID=A0A1F7UPW9_9BACT|nr:MAG: hypothetical protein A2936_02940 [Candidatus Uhrbacteria bacterium RIFCSPLOWO2_01_FULL_47_25]OGL91319.1 MAG: hypothetical protein A3H10_03530 [Candidatus Uhrbacteria bacterium RIFCSPLOWO2_12_FULL_46_10]